MLLEDYNLKPLASLQYSDRYINDGSPSGFTELYRTSPSTDPFGSQWSYNLFYLEDDDINFEVYAKNNFVINNLKNILLIHPDMIKQRELNGYNIKKFIDFDVIPTSSCRTVQINSELYSNDYLKLHYNGVIGRINRSLPRRKAINGVEISYMLLENYKKNIFPESFGFLNEPYAITHLNKNIENKNLCWSYVWREAKPTILSIDKIIFMLPLFSLWSKDRINPNHINIFKQLIFIWGKESIEIIVNLLFNIIDSYFILITKLGLQNELNAQNILMGFSNDYFPCAIIIRDLMGIEKDLPLRRILGLNNDFDADDYKIISELDEDDKYIKRHSFAFDFKLSHYVLKPIIDLTVKSNLINQNELKKLIKQRVANWIKYLPDSYFPKNKWYLHRKELLVDGKIFIEKNNPLFR